jgi:predicted nucleic acid-binding protein
VAAPEARSTRYVIALDAALRLFRERATPPAGTKLVAPTLLRSQPVAHLYAAARSGEIDRAEAGAQLDHMRALNIRLLGDRVLQKFAWDFAERLGWEDTFTAEYVALTKLQADAFVTLDQGLARVAGTLVPVASYDQMLGERLPQPSP